MPELPEVEYTARQLRASVIGAEIDNAQVFWERSIGHPGVADFMAEVAGKCITDVRRRGKFLIIDLVPANDAANTAATDFLTIHRRMTGNLLLLPPGWEIDCSLREQDATAWNTRGPTFIAPDSAAPVAENGGAIHISDTNYCRICFNFRDGRRLIYTDQRKFGRIECWSREQEAKVFANLGAEPLEENFTAEKLANALAQRQTAIKPALLDQTIVAGLGNIYADEALFAAHIHPLRRANSLSLAESAALRDSIVAILAGSIEHGGTSFSDYRGLWGEAGENYNHVRVYQRDGKPCLRCGTPIERIVIAQRSAHFCPTCQAL
jgi:formamidopyrimidine-DNA glycosylase